MKINTNFKKILLLLILTVSFFSLFTQKTLAGNVEIINYTQPPENKPWNKKLDFSLTYKVLPTSTQPAIDAIVFTADVDGIKHKVTNNPGVAPSDLYYVINIPKTNKNIGKTYTVRWSDYNPINSIGGLYTWKLYDAYTKKPYVASQFFVGADLSSGKGFYFIAKDKSKTDPKYYFTVSDKYKDLDSCNIGWQEYSAKWPTASSDVPVCKEYTTKPITPVDVPLNKPVDTDTTYQPLAPLPDGSGKFLDKFNSAEPCALTKYLNILIKLIIGIAAVLSVIMIVMGGIEYMTSELISSKEAGKSRIMNAVFGLILALGSYAILYTLNPKLLDVCLGNLNKVDVQIDPETEIAPWTSYSSGAPGVGACKEGIVDVPVVWKSGTPNPNKIRVCKTLAKDLETIIAKATNEGINLTGGALRTQQDQINLRIANKCPDIYKSPANDCKPPTARPGHSMHEKGLAIDFSCDNKPIGQNDHGNKCFIWLSKNAPPALKNLKSEAWHWSTTGA